MSVNETETRTHCTTTQMKTIEEYFLCATNCDAV